MPLSPRLPVSPFQFANFTATNVYNQCTISYFSGFVPIRLHLTKLDDQTVNGKVTEIVGGPMIHLESGTVAGGVSVGYGVNELPKLVMEGWIDTPVNSNSSPTPTFTVGGGIVLNMFYADFMSTCMDGRINVNANTDWWVRQDPDWFRDPYGRVYNTPRVIAFSASRIEAVPGRENFQMTLLVGMNS